MSGWLGNLVPSLGALGVWTYWIVGAFSLLEAFFVTGVIAPGTLVVDTGGALVRLGKLDFFDLVFFVAAGAAIGGELGFWTGRKAGERLTGRWDPAGSKAYGKAVALFRRHGGLALVIGRFLGPVAGLASLAAAMSGMDRRRFAIWNIASAIPYAFAHVAIGYAAGDVLARIGPQLTRAAMLIGALAAVFALIWFVSRQIRRGLPLFLAGGAALRDAVLTLPWMQRQMTSHPAATRWLAARFDATRFGGLMTTFGAAVFLYLAFAWVDTVLDFVYVPAVAETDLRLARLLHTFWTPAALDAFSLITQLGHSTVVAGVLAGAILALVVARRWASLAQLMVAVGGELVTVRLLKGAFARPRPELGYFVETSGSFPSGHATLSVAFWGTLCVILWRERLIGPTFALVSALVLAFLIGFSRLYLIEHFLSDVVNGWLLGSLWLVIGVAVAEALRARGWVPRRLSPGRGIVALAVLVLGLGVAGWQIAVTSPPRAAAAAAALPEVIEPSTAIGTAALPMTVETLDGAAGLPAGLFLVAPDLATVEAALASAGWSAVHRPTAGALVHAAWADWTGKADPTAPLMPLFWIGTPQDAGWRNAEGTLEVRLWQATSHDPAGRPVFALALTPTGEGEGDWALTPALRTLAAGLTPDRVSEVDGFTPAEGTTAESRRWNWDGTVLLAEYGPPA